MNITQQREDMFATTDESTLTYHNHLKAIIFIIVHSWCVHSMGLNRWIITCIHHYGIMKSIFTALNTSCISPVFLSYTSTPSNHWAIYYLHSFAYSEIYFFKIYLFILEKENMQGEGERIWSQLHVKQGAPHRDRSHSPEIMTKAKTQG